jgi:hypothetical protein
LHVELDAGDDLVAVLVELSIEPPEPLQQRRLEILGRRREVALRPGGRFPRASAATDVFDKLVFAAERADEARVEQVLGHVLRLLDWHAELLVELRQEPRVARRSGETSLVVQARDPRADFRL